MGRHEWNFYTDEAKEYPVLIASAIKNIIIILERCVVDGTLISPQRRGETRRATSPREREGGKGVSLTGGCFLHLLPLPLLLLSLENIQRNT